MDTKHLKILQLLNESGANNPVNISPLLLTMFPNVDRMNVFETRWAAGIINKLLEDMKGQGWIDVPKYMSIGNGNNSNGYTWLDIVQINAFITSKGIDRLEEELKKTQEDRLTESILETNQSIQELNKETALFYTHQDNFNRWQKGLTIAIGLFTLAQVLLAMFKKDAKPETIQIPSLKEVESKLHQLEDKTKAKASQDSLFDQAVKDSLKMK